MVRAPVARSLKPLTDRSNALLGGIVADLTERPELNVTSNNGFLLFW
jgi:hypothetical protein